MQIFIDDKPDLVFAEAGGKLGEFLQQLRDWLKTHRLVITQLMLDGEFLTAERRAELSKISVDAFDTLKVATVDPMRLSRRTLTEVGEHLPPLAKSLVEITENIQKGDLQAAWLKLTLSFDVWSVIIEAIDKVASLTQIDVATFQVKGTLLSDKIAELKGLLEKAKTAMEDQDIVTVGDLMEYEFAPRIEDWSDIVEAIAAEIDKHLTG